MQRLMILTFWFLHLLTGHSNGLQQSAPAAEIQSPLPGQAIQGNQIILGNSDVPGFQSAELSFTYFDNPTNTWFILAQSDQPVANNALAQWDTTLISDGIYTLRLVITLASGSQQVVTVPGIRVRNYTPIETDTPTPILPSATPVPGSTSPPTQPPATSTPASASFTATPLPVNPAHLETRDVLASVVQGALGILGVFIIIGLYGALRALLHRS
ncbi:MAG: hypothetical protein AB1894_18815 [Chloroflexota bacterium]